MNRTLGIISSAVVTAATVGFALGMLLGCLPACYITSLFISWGYLLLACGFAAEAAPLRKTAAFAGIGFACLYAVFVGAVYFAQLTTVASGNAPADALAVLSYQSAGSLMFNYDLFGYALMAFSTFFAGLSLAPESKPDRWLKALLMIHGLFVVVGIMPMLGMFNPRPGADAGAGAQAGTIALLAWCAYFTPVGILAILHFRKDRGQAA